MGKYKFKLKEISGESTLKPSEVDPSFLKNITLQYGKVDMENDFFSPDLETYYKTEDTNKETGGITHKLIKLASFDDIITKLSQANNSSEILQNNATLQADTELQKILKDVNRVFNDFRTHLRKGYPEQYKKISKLSLDEESSTGATGSGPETPLAFKPIRKQLGEAQLTDFQNKRIEAFNTISSEMNDIYTRLDNAKDKTADFYNTHPESTKIIYPTELVQSYFEDINLILNQEIQ